MTPTQRQHTKKLYAEGKRIYSDTEEIGGCFDETLTPIIVHRYNSHDELVFALSCAYETLNGAIITSLNVKELVRKTLISAQKEG